MEQAANDRAPIGNGMKAGYAFVNTPRISLFPLSFDQLLKYMNNDGKLEKELKLKRSNRELTADLHGSLNANILDNVADEEKDYRFYSLWVIVDRESKRMVGDLCFMGEPALDGKSEVGYGTYASCQSKGYMTEALSALLHWARFQTHMKGAMAWTKKDNLPSIRVLEKNGFQNVKETQELLQWMINW